MIHANTDPSVHGAGSRLLAHIAAMNPSGPCSPADTWTWLYPPGRPEETEALRCGYLWSQSPHGPLVVVEWRPDEDPALLSRPLPQRADRATVWAWPSGAQMIVTDVLAWAPPAAVEAYLRRVLAIAEGRL